ncbi:hypothetical protein SEVIR_4G246600v4 [Setaria viridis]|uniref:Tetraspanin n=2 Tax=Setaria TaxID=4554 RepID=K3XYR5_SETIT|nr:tetraspanin-2 [Setaria italica]XP_034589521.1 tetraspanin-2-like [Setaria viridis]RCV22614.1 hypothetical protein SETIT_4G234400v2 [Setaria italica]TKW22722.1 hypothetical protein SEVIR_4G246600v2 [Setaria viridis]
MAVSNNITACINFLVLLCTVPIAATGVWLASRHGGDGCARLARWPVAALGALLLLVALAGFLGAYRNRRGLLACYLFAMAGLITLLLALIVLAFAVTHGSGAYPVPGRAYDDYRLEGYSPWLRRYVAGDPERWEGIRACVAGSGTCRKLATDRSFIVPEQFYMTHLSPIQSGCCKPPTVCGYAYVGPTAWAGAANPAADADCAAWSNDPALLCYGCASCKAGVLGELRQQWRKANVALLVAAVALVFVYLVGCCAFRNAQTEDMFRRYKWGNNY